MRTAALAPDLEEALLRENALLIEALRERTVAPSVAPLAAPARVETLEPTPLPAPPPAKTPAPPRRRIALPKEPKEYTVPDEEKWWNRP